MVRIYSPERSELQAAFANRFKRIVRRDNKIKSIAKWFRDILFLFFLFLLAVAIGFVLVKISGL